MYELLQGFQPPQAVNISHIHVVPVESSLLNSPRWLQRPLGWYLDIVSHHLYGVTNFATDSCTLCRA